MPAHPNHLDGMSATAIILLFSYKALSEDEKGEEKADKSAGRYFIYVLIGLLTLILYLTKLKTSWIIIVVFFIIYDIVDVV